MPLRPRKKQTFAIEWESSLNTLHYEGRFSFVCRFHEKRQKKSSFFSWESHNLVCIYYVVLALLLFEKEVRIFLWMDCLQDWFDASMNILNGMKKEKSFFLWLETTIFLYICYICTRKITIYHGDLLSTTTLKSGREKLICGIFSWGGTSEKKYQNQIFVSQLQLERIFLNGCSRKQEIWLEFWFLCT